MEQCDLCSSYHPVIKHVIGKTMLAEKTSSKDAEIGPHHPKTKA